MSNKHTSNQSHTETIIPLSVPIQRNGSGPRGLRSRHRFSIIILIGSLIILAAGGVWLLHYLSKNPLRPQPVPDKPAAEQPEKPSPAAVAPPETPLLPAVDPEQLALDKQAAENQLAEFLAAKNALDHMGADRWAGKSYREMTEISSRADALLIDKAYPSAAAEYARAAVIGRQLAEQADAALPRLLAEGRTALNEGNGAVARRKFEVALMIDPANPSAQKGLKRSQSIDTVLGLIESGRQHEKNGALSQARADYQKALELDPEVDEADRALTRVTELLTAQRFSQLMSAGLAAFHDNDYPLARSRLLEAKSIKPESREVSEALLQVDQAQRLARIDRLRDAAQKAEQSEDWQAALKSYLAVLAIDPNLQFATRGKHRAAARIQITKRLDFFLSNPQVLASDKQLENALGLLKEARQTSPRGQKLTRRISALEKSVATAQTPVTVTIESDNLTEIAVYKVGKLGRFSRRELSLRPGTYTVVGARDGYQDVRQKFTVKAGQQALRITVECRVKI